MLLIRPPALTVVLTFMVCTPFVWIVSFVERYLFRLPASASIRAGLDLRLDLHRIAPLLRWSAAAAQKPAGPDSCFDFHGVCLLDFVVFAGLYPFLDG